METTLFRQDFRTSGVPVWGPVPWSAEVAYAVIQPGVGLKPRVATVNNPYIDWAKSLVAPINDALQGRDKTVRWSFEDAREAIVHVRGSGPGIAGTFAFLFGRDNTIKFHAYGAGLPVASVLPRVHSLDLSRPCVVTVVAFANAIHFQITQAPGLLYMYSIRHPKIEEGGPYNGIGCVKQDGRVVAREVEARDVGGALQIVLVTDGTPEYKKVAGVLQSARPPGDQAVPLLVTHVELASYDELATAPLAGYRMSRGTNVAIVLMGGALSLPAARQRAIAAVNDATSRWVNDGFVVWVLTPPPVRSDDPVSNAALFEYGQTLKQSAIAGRVLLGMPPVFVAAPSTPDPLCYDASSKLLNETGLGRLAEEITDNLTSSTGGGEVVAVAEMALKTLRLEDWVMEMDPATSDLHFKYHNKLVCRWTS